MRILTLSQLSLAGSSGIAEAKIPLWWADGTTTTSGASASGTQFVQDGSTISTSTGSASKIFTLSSNWLASTQFAFEATLYSANSAGTAYASLYDFTSSAVAGSSVSTSSTTATVIRSGKFTLIPGHVYGVTTWVSNTSYAEDFIDASLIIFP